VPVAVRGVYASVDEVVPGHERAEILLPAVDAAVENGDDGARAAGAERPGVGKVQVLKLPGSRIEIRIAGADFVGLGAPVSFDVGDDRRLAEPTDGCLLRSRRNAGDGYPELADAAQSPRSNANESSVLRGRARMLVELDKQARRRGRCPSRRGGGGLTTEPTTGRTARNRANERSTASITTEIARKSLESGGKTLSLPTHSEPIRPTSTGKALARSGDAPTGPRTLETRDPLPARIPIRRRFGPVFKSHERLPIEERCSVSRAAGLPDRSCRA